LGITPGDEPIVGIPDADTFIKTKQKIASEEQRNDLKDKQIKADLLKTGMTNMNRQRSLNG
jgi:hypothetical protein